MKLEEVKIDVSPIFRDVGVIKGPEGTFEQALNLAKAKGTRLFTAAEAMYLFENSESFRAMARDCKFWVIESTSANTPPSLSDYAWYFDGCNGFVKRQRLCLGLRPLD